ncbi:C40 family peptidase [Streptomyces sp. NPDC004658]|uniref:C40 family peptidase n=1 Tax=Streptomyces sp. NPDC004658 TaxID=3154672 RepID=UPI00339F584B
MAPESRDEVRQRIASLYDRAENDTGNFNATRAMAARSRSRGVPLAKRSGRRADPALDEIARQWFDAARADLGPTVPAVLPADRLPDGPPAPARSREGMEELPLPGSERGVRALPGGGSDPLGLPGPPAGGRELRALPGGERPALETGGLPGQRSALARGTGHAVAELTAAPATDAPSGSLPAVPSEAGWPQTGALQTGALQTGTSQTGSWQTGAVQTGASQSGSWQTGAVQTEAPQTGSWQTGASQSGSWQTGAVQTEAPQTGSWQTGTLQTEATHTGPWQTGTLQTEATHTGPWQTGTLQTEAVPALETGRGALADAGSSGELPVQSVGLRDGTADTAGWATAGPSSPAVLPVAAQPGVQRTAAHLPRALPGSAGFGRLSPSASKAGARRRLDTARDLLSRRTARPVSPGSAVQLAPVPPDLPTGAQQLTQPAVTSTRQWRQRGAEPVLPAAPTAGALPAGITAPMTDTGSLSLPLPAPAPTPAAAPAGATPAPAPVEPPRALRAAKAIAFARAQLGKPCVWGATGPDSYDCSSLTQAAWKAAGVMLPRAAHEQALAGAPLTTAGLEPGDLVLFFEDDRHVGLYTGDGMMVHAPGPGSSIREESIYGAGEAAIHRIVRPA